MAQAKVVVSSGNVRLELEGEQGFVEANLEKLLPMVRPSDGGSAEAKGEDGGGTVAETQAAEVTRQTLKRFFKGKGPGNSYEAIAVALHYKRQHEHKDELSATEIRTSAVSASPEAT